MVHSPFVLALTEKADLPMQGRAWGAQNNSIMPNVGLWAAEDN